MKKLFGLFLLLAGYGLVSCNKTGSTPPPNSGNSSSPTGTTSSKSTPIAPPVVGTVAPQQGPGSTTVTITGTGFSDTTANDTVYFNGRMAKITGATTTQLVVTVPLLAGTGPVAVRVHGDSVTGPTFTYQYQYAVTTLAGGSQGNVDGTGSAASFDYMVGIAADASGNLYVGDQFNEKVRKVTPAGVVTTYAGNGQWGHIDGAGNQAEFYYPTGIAADSSGDVFVTDLGGNRIRFVTTQGVVSTVAGTGTAASFYYPYGIAIDKTGNLYIADQRNCNIRKITPAGVVTTLAGNGSPGSTDGTGTAASFNSPCGVTVDSAGNVYVADEGNDEIRMITPAGVVTTIAGNGTGGHADGTGSAATFEFPYGITITRTGILYVTDQGNEEIRQIVIQ
jgi:sugar lactone lactonase YvrE